MQRVGIKALKDRLSEYVRAAAAGQTVLVTDRGRVVAELVPPRGHDQGSPAERRMADLVRHGLVRPASVAPHTRLPRRKPLAPLDAVLLDLEAARSER